MEKTWLVINIITFMLNNLLAATGETLWGNHLASVQSTNLINDSSDIRLSGRQILCAFCFVIDCIFII